MKRANNIQIYLAWTWKSSLRFCLPSNSNFNDTTIRRLIQWYNILRCNCILSLGLIRNSALVTFRRENISAVYTCSQFSFYLYV